MAQSVSDVVPPLTPSTWWCRGAVMWWLLYGVSVAARRGGRCIVVAVNERRPGSVYWRCPGRCVCVCECKAMRLGARGPRMATVHFVEWFIHSFVYLLILFVY